MKILPIASVLFISSVFAFFTGCSDSSTNQVGVNVDPSSKVYETLCSSPEGSDGMASASYASSFKMNKLFTLTDNYGITLSYLYMNKPLAESSIQDFNLYTKPSILVMRKNDDGNTQVFGLYTSLFQGPFDKGEEGQLYKFEGCLRDINGFVVEGTFLEGDRVLFNVPWSYDLEDDGNSEFDYTATEWAQLMAWAKTTDVYMASSSGEKITGFTGANEPHVLTLNSCSASL